MLIFIFFGECTQHNMMFILCIIKIKRAAIHFHLLKLLTKQAELNV